MEKLTKAFSARKIVQIASAMDDLQFTARLSLRTAMAVYDTQNAFRTARDSIGKQELEIIERIGGTVEGGRPMFHDTASFQLYIKEREALMNDTSDVEFVVCDLSDYADIVRIGVDSYGILSSEGICIFGGD